MAKTSTSFKEGNNGKPKGAKHQRTKLKEALGIKNWEQLKDYVEGKGLEKCIDELQKQKGGDFIYAYLTLAEFVKPKLARTTIVGDKDQPMQGELKITVVTSTVPVSESEEDVS